jgi:hypothetical protein
MLIPLTPHDGPGATRLPLATDADVTSAHGGWVFELQRFARGVRPQPMCEICAAPMGDKHAHLVRLATGTLVCACNGCALLLGHADSPQFRRVPERIVALDGLDLPEHRWAALQIPVDLAFLHVSTREGGAIACHPGPAGVTHAALDPRTWQEVLGGHPMLAGLEDDVEALLVRRVGEVREGYRVPIDQCYALVGLLRQSWRGASGGEAAFRGVDAFFAHLKRGEPGHA